ncbi:MAG: MBL fold metallo-hydrolase [Nitrososphaerota archaeon]|jgi:putative mRNA 3-end processing factor|nr:MBL fold metallo-hydrolase [Nitrososphaerota archaeon]MDG6926877.1 MBL fold metallo-hydrolase [Nitrososphaerota archaeon]MDG6930005.1 MBL fold metallo-hydrolase [Nitrososphaerota archaeon]MDG6931956.1 MBL fold metallo-hydrolase [Nitrososphaerota archaeon]MDG6943841.1 MBL fold metallo-hydrolase [Nitrososphaerota archaeon]
MQIKILGAAGTVGNSGFLVKDDATTLLLDYGLNPGKNMVHPMHVRPKDINALITTHAHLDHIGYEPYLYVGKGIPNYATRPTIEISEILLKDLLKISGERLPFTSAEVENLIRMSNPKEYNEEFSVDGLNVTFLNAGHIPGSAMVYIKGSKKVLYTGDINHIASRLLEPASYDLPEVDYVISECTYATREHEDRGKEEKRLIDFSNEVIESGGTVLIPSFAVGRAQEVAEIYYYNNFKHDVYMDGMALTINDILLKNPGFIKDPNGLKSALKSVKYINGWAERRKAIKKHASIISPAGMLVGGASVFYSRKISTDPKNGIAIVSYQVEGTPGRSLVDEGEVMLDGKLTSVKARVLQFELSSHSGKSQLLEMFRKMKGSPTVILVHGDGDSCESMAQELAGMGIKAICPKNGDIIE